MCQEKRVITKQREIELARLKGPAFVNVCSTFSNEDVEAASVQKLAVYITCKAEQTVADATYWAYLEKGCGSSLNQKELVNPLNRKIVCRY